MQVLSSTRLGKTATLSIVSVDGRRLVLGVTAQGVNVLAELPEEQAGEPAPAGAIPQPRAAAEDKPGFAQLLATQLQRQASPAAAGAAPLPAPPTPAAFLRDVWSSVRRRPLETSDVSSDAVAAALALAAGPPAAALPGPASSTDRLPASPTSADGSATTRARAIRRPAPRTDAQRLEEKRPWSRVCRTPSRTPDRDAALV
jgi:hypothetical protein